MTTLFLQGSRPRTGPIRAAGLIASPPSWSLGLSASVPFRSLFGCYRKFRVVGGGRSAGPAPCSFLLGQPGFGSDVAGRDSVPDLDAGVVGHRRGEVALPRRLGGVGGAALAVVRGEVAVVVQRVGDYRPAADDRPVAAGCEGEVQLRGAGAAVVDDGAGPVAAVLDHAFQRPVVAPDGHGRALAVHPQGEGAAVHQVALGVQALQVYVVAGQGRWSGLDPVPGRYVVVHGPARGREAGDLERGLDVDVVHVAAGGVGEDLLGGAQGPAVLADVGAEEQHVDDVDGGVGIEVEAAEVQAGGGDRLADGAAEEHDVR